MYSYRYARKYRISLDNINNNIEIDPAVIMDSTTNETSGDESTLVMDLESQSSHSEIAGPSTVNWCKTMEFVLINVELVNEVTNRKLYGFVELNVPWLPLDYKHT